MFLLLIPLIGLIGCAHHVDIFFQAVNDLNNGGNPVVVRIFQLTTDVNFKSESSESFWRNNQTSFQKDVVGKPTEIVLHPREVLKLTDLEINDETVFLGVAADFYKPDKNQWQYLFDITKYEGGKILIAVRNNTLVITEVDE
jgi:type VI secretion system VasD/TssJ family lipoprotein